MRALRDLANEPDLPGMALAILGMTRLWVSTPEETDMAKAREIEADLVLTDFLLTQYNPAVHGFTDAT